MIWKDSMELEGLGGTWLQETGLGGCRQDQNQRVFLSPVPEGISGLGSFGQQTTLGILAIPIQTATNPFAACDRQLCAQGRGCLLIRWETGSNRPQGSILIHSSCVEAQRLLWTKGNTWHLGGEGWMD